jgi:type IV pilus assembly protein PilB
MERVLIGQLLLQGGAIDARQLRVGLDWQKRRGGRLGHALVHLGLVQETDLVRALGRQFQIPVVDLAGRSVAAEVLLLVPRRIVEGRCVLPLELLSECRRGPLLVATSDPLDLAAMDEVAFASGKLVRPVLAAKDQLEAAISRHLGRGRPDAIDLPAAALEDMQLVQPLRPGAFWN